MRFRARLFFVGKLAVLAGALAGTYALFAFVSLQIAIKAREVPTPDLRGLAPAEASDRLTEVGLTARFESQRRIHHAISAGSIAEQDPRPGRPTRRRRSVKLWLSSGPNAGRIPSLIGESEGLATRRLVDNVFTLGGVAEIRSGRYPTGAVVAQEPPPAGDGETVFLLVNRGERGRTYVMPDLIGINGDDAAELLRARGFRVTVVGDHPYPGIPSGVVIRQAPDGGFQIAQGEPISLEVSQ